MTSDDPASDPSVAEALGALDVLRLATWQGAVRSGRLRLTERVAEVCAEQLCLPPEVPPRGVGTGPGDGWLSGAEPGEGDHVVLDVAAQFSVDVAALSDRQRDDFFGWVGDQAADVAAMVFVMDFFPRVRAAAGSLSDTAEPLVPPDAPSDPGETSVWGAIDSFSRAVARIRALDPVTTELVRLRGARQHQCRLCMSVRSRAALAAGADDELFGAVDDYEESGCTPLQRAALAFTDAMIWTPGRLDAVAPRLIASAAAEERMAVVLNVTRNALNKIAVALRADGPHVDEGVELFDVDREGNVVYGAAVDG